MNTETVYLGRSKEAARQRREQVGAWFKRQRDQSIDRSTIYGDKLKLESKHDWVVVIILLSPVSSAIPISFAHQICHISKKMFFFAKICLGNEKPFSTRSFQFLRFFSGFLRIRSRRSRSRLDISWEPILLGSHEVQKSQQLLPETRSEHEEEWEMEKKKHLYNLPSASHHFLPSFLSRLQQKCETELSELIMSDR